MRDCDKYKEEMKTYLEEKLSPEKISGFERHILSCPSCLREVVEQEPTKLFLLLREEKLKPALLEGLDQGILANIEKGRERSIWASLIAKPAYALLVVAFSIIGIFFAWLYLSGELKGGKPPFAWNMADKGASPIIQDIGEEEARVYQLEIGEKTHLLMVVLPELEFLK